jgi:hypothetical protein
MKNSDQRQNGTVQIRWSQHKLVSGSATRSEMQQREISEWEDATDAGPKTERKKMSWCANLGEEMKIRVDLRGSGIEASDTKTKELNSNPSC